MEGVVLLLCPQGVRFEVDPRICDLTAYDIVANAKRNANLFGRRLDSRELDVLLANDDRLQYRSSFPVSHSSGYEFGSERLAVKII